MQNIIARFVLGAIVLGMAMPHITHAAVKQYYNQNGIAIQGYDPVAYFTESRPVRGKEAFNFVWMDTTWHFSSAANRDTFAANPTKYAPQYNGYCAYAAANNYVSSINPRAWSVHQGKLYLNAGLGVRVRWSINKDGYIASANKNWPQLKQKLP